MMERYLIDHCSPTLAGLKTGNLFSCPDADKSLLDCRLRQINSVLNAKDVYLEVLRRCGGRALIYVYRRGHLQKELKDARTSRLLSSLGYMPEDAGSCVSQLRQRLAEGGDFPHEIGVFLGYPIEDVVGFIENGGRNCKHTGLWKVYGDVRRALRLFGQYKKCRDIYTRLFLDGRTIVQLTVAA